MASTSTPGVSSSPITSDSQTLPRSSAVVVFTSESSLDNAREVSKSTKISERFWGDGRVFRTLLDPSSTTAEDVPVTWFGPNSRAVVRWKGSEQAIAKNERGQRLGLDEWTAKVCDSLSDTVRRDVQDILGMLLSGYGVLVSGSSGTGKSLVLETIARTSGLDRPSDVCIIKGGDAAARDVRALVNAIDECGGAIVLDDVDRLMPRRKALNADRRQSCLLIRAVQRARDRKTLVLASSSHPDQVDPDAMQFGVIDRTFRMRAPDHAERVALLAHRTDSSPPICDWIAQRTGGWSRAELDAFARKVQLSKLDYSRDNGSAEAGLDKLLLEARKNTSIYREAVFVLPDDDDEQDDQKGTEPEDTFISSKIGGLAHVRSVLSRAVISFLRNREERGTRGVLLHGPSGNGKTLTGLALGQYAQRHGLANFVCVRCLDLVSKIVGETESNVARVFARARDCSPCVLFLDQLDALAPRRSALDEESTTERTFERVLSVLLVELDGILTKDFEGKMVVMAAVRSVKDLEPAVVRPGRLGTHVLVDLPRMPSERMDVMKVCTRSLPIKTISDDFFLRMSAELLEGKSRADIANVCREAATLALRADINADQVGESHFLQAIEMVSGK